MQLLVDLWGNETTEIIYYFFNFFFFKTYSLASLQQSSPQSQSSTKFGEEVERSSRGEEESEGASGASFSSRYPEVLSLEPPRPRTTLVTLQLCQASSIQMSLQLARGDTYNSLVSTMLLCFVSLASLPCPS